MTNDLTKRQENILYAIVQEFITLKKPVSSKKILDITNLDCSSATIRSEMKRLESMAYIFQPYTSAGRMPTDKGYRFYVDCLKGLRDTPEIEKSEITLLDNFKYSNIDELIKQFTVFLSRWMNGLAIVEKPFIDRLRINKISLSNIFLNYWVVVVITNMGISETFIVPMDEKYPMKDFEDYLSDKLHGLSLSELKELLEQMDLPEFSWYYPDVEHVFTFLSQMVNRTVRNRFEKYGFELLVQDETLSQEDLKGCLVYTEDDRRIVELLNIFQDNEDLKVNIGTENRKEDLEGFSVFFKDYSGGSQKLGRMMVLTSKTTDYLQNLKGIQYVGNRLSEYLTRIMNFND